MEFSTIATLGPERPAVIKEEALCFLTPEQAALAYVPERLHPVMLLIDRHLKRFGEWISDYLELPITEYHFTNWLPPCRSNVPDFRWDVDGGALVALAVTCRFKISTGEEIWGRVSAVYRLSKDGTKLQYAVF